MIKKHVVNNRSNAKINIHRLIHANIIKREKKERKRTFTSLLTERQAKAE